MRIKLISMHCSVNKGDVERSLRVLGTYKVSNNALEVSQGPSVGWLGLDSIGDFG